MNTRKVKCHRNSDTKTGNRKPHQYIFTGVLPGHVVFGVLISHMKN